MLVPTFNLFVPRINYVIFLSYLYLISTKKIIYPECMAHMVSRTYFSSFFDQMTGEKFHFQLESSKIAMILLKLHYFSKGFLKTAHIFSGVQDFVFLSSYLDFPSNFASRRCHNTSIYTSSKIDQNLHFCQKFCIKPRTLS